MRALREKLQGMLDSAMAAEGELPARIEKLREAIERKQSNFPAEVTRHRQLAAKLKTKVERICDDALAALPNAITESDVAEVSDTCDKEFKHSATPFGFIKHLAESFPKDHDHAYFDKDG